jgi:hypothetical protein
MNQFGKCSEISVECKGHDLGCNWTGRARDHREHIRSCSHGTPQYVYDCIIRLYRNHQQVGSRVREMIGCTKIVWNQIV